MIDFLERNGVGESLFLKVEYQTLVKLKENSEFTLFSIRTFNDKLSHIASYKHAAVELSRNIRSLPDNQFAVYKGLARQCERDLILAYLDAISNSDGESSPSPS